ncbi:hypothetical protein H6F71_06060 [Microcoleus sp. FACHB-61]|nr:hypothetical protein [Microcoleus sp. FACHB-61]
MTQVNVCDIYLHLIKSEVRRKDQRKWVFLLSSIALDERFSSLKPGFCAWSLNVKLEGKTETFLDALLSLKTGFFTASGFWRSVRPGVD